MTPSERQEFAKSLLTLQQEVHENVLIAVTGGIWTPIMIAVTWAIAVPFFLFVAAH